MGVVKLTVSGCDVILDRRKCALIAYVARIVQLLCLGFLNFAGCNNLLRFLLKFNITAHFGFSVYVLILRVRLIATGAALLLGSFEVG